MNENLILIATFVHFLVANTYKEVKVRIWKCTPIIPVVCKHMKQFQNATHLSCKPQCIQQKTKVSCVHM